MTDSTPDNDPSPSPDNDSKANDDSKATDRNDTLLSRPFGRRRFITWSAVFGAAAATPIVAARAFDHQRSNSAATLPSVTGDEPTSTPDPSSSPSVTSDGDLILVSVQLAGGNDGLNTVVDHSNGRYRDARGELALGPEQLDLLDDRFGLYSMPNVAKQWQAGNVAIVHGLGHSGSPLSHFTATDVWNAGSTDPSEPTGWLGRALSAARGRDAIAFDGISLGNLTASMRHPAIDPVSLPVESEFMPWSPADQREHRNAFSAMKILAAPTSSDSPLSALVRSGQAAVMRVGEELGQLVDDQQAKVEAAEIELESMGLSEDEIEVRRSVGALDPQFDTIASLINGGVWTSAYHVQQDGYDTHESQAEVHPYLLRGLDTSLARFWEQLGPNAARVVVMTWSEFGRRPSFNGSGTDHGTSSIGMVIGHAVNGGHYGEPSPLEKFDTEGNFIPTTDFRRYLAGVAGSVLGVDPKDVANTDGAPLALLG